MHRPTLFAPILAIAVLLTFAMATYAQPLESAAIVFAAANVAAEQPIPLPPSIHEVPVVTANCLSQFFDAGHHLWRCPLADGSATLFYLGVSAPMYLGYEDAVSGAFVLNDTGQDFFGQVSGLAPPNPSCRPASEYKVYDCNYPEGFNAQWYDFGYGGMHMLAIDKGDGNGWVLTALGHSHYKR